MRNYAWQTDNNFFIAKEDIPKAMSLMECDTTDPKNFEEEMHKTAGYWVEFDKDGNLVFADLSEAEWYDEGFLKKIAPVVRSGSYLEFYDEDGDRWRIVFDGGEAKRQKAHFAHHGDTLYTVTLTTVQLDKDPVALVSSTHCVCLDIIQAKRKVSEVIQSVIETIGAGVSYKKIEISDRKWEVVCNNTAYLVQAERTVLFNDNGVELKS